MVIGMRERSQDARIGGKVWGVAEEYAEECLTVNWVKNIQNRPEQYQGKAAWDTSARAEVKVIGNKKFKMPGWNSILCMCGACFLEFIENLSLFTNPQGCS